MTDTKKKKIKATVENSNLASSRPKAVKANGLELLLITRETYRAPVDPSVPVQVQIGKRRFDVVNVSRRGIGFMIPSPETFLPEEVIDPVTVICGKERIVVKGRVVHISPGGAERYLCGVEIIHAEKDSLQQFEAHLERNRLALFSKKEPEPE